MDDVTKRFTFKADTTKHTLIFHPAGDTAELLHGLSPASQQFCNPERQAQKWFYKDQGQNETASDYRLIKNRMSRVRDL